MEGHLGKQLIKSDTEDRRRQPCRKVASYLIPKLIRGTGKHFDIASFAAIQILSTKLKISGKIFYL